MRFRKPLFVVILLVVLCTEFGCEEGTESSPVGIPSLTTTEITNITSSSATCGGNITYDGGAAVISRGVCWSTNSNPTTADNATTNGSGTGSFASTITGLTPNTTYYVCAYAINSAGTAYGNTITFSTSTNISFDYLGQVPPGLMPVPFAHNIFRNYDLHSSPAFSPNGDEVFWSAFDLNLQSECKYQLWYMKKENGTWATPLKATFFLNALCDSPTFSPDGSKIYFLSCAPTAQAPNNTKENLYYANKLENGWSDPILLDNEFDSFIFHWQVSIATNGNIYFSGGRIDSGNVAERDIFVAHYVNEGYSNFTNLGSSVNITNEMESTPWISPDESYIIFSRGGATNFSDLFVSFKNLDGTWTNARNMTGINSSYTNLNPIVTPDGMSLIFTSERDGMPYWVDASVIEQYR